MYARALQQWQAVELPCLAALLSEIASWLAWVGWIGGWLHAFYAIVPTNASKRRQCNQQGSKWLHVLVRPFLQPSETIRSNKQITLGTGYEDNGQAQ